LPSGSPQPVIDPLQFGAAASLAFGGLPWARRLLVRGTILSILARGLLRASLVVRLILSAGIALDAMIAAAILVLLVPTWP